MSGPAAAERPIVCPHCKKRFEGRLLTHGPRAGFKCPHCRLFVPAERADDAASAGT